MSAVRVTDLSWNYGSRETLAGVSMMAEQGAFTALLGPNGSGKTTLLRLISGGLRTPRGTVFIGGDDVALLNEAQLARRMALVPQRSGMAFNFTALEVVLMGRHPYIGRFGSESARDVDIALEAMEGTGTRHLAKRSAMTLSGGEWQRVAVARALCQQTNILLLDEPVSSLDLRHQADVLALARQQARRGVAVLCVLHDLNLAAEYADRVVVIGEGCVAADGTPGEVLTPELVQRVWNAGVLVGAHPQTGKPVFLMDYAAGAV